MHISAHRDPSTLMLDVCHTLVCSNTCSSYAACKVFVWEMLRMYIMQSRMFAAWLRWRGVWRTLFWVWNWAGWSGKILKLETRKLGPTFPFVVVNLYHATKFPVTTPQSNYCWMPDLENHVCLPPLCSDIRKTDAHSWARGGCCRGCLRHSHLQGGGPC